MQPEHLGHDELDFGRVLRRGVNDDLTLLAGIGDRRLRFEVKLFLAEVVEYAREAMRRRFQRGSRIAAGNVSRRADETLQLDGALDRQDRLGGATSILIAAGPFPKSLAIRRRSPRPAGRRTALRRRPGTVHL